MADFTGMTVKVTLKQPPNTILHGRVKEIIAGQTLSLEDVFFPSSGTRWGQWTVQGTAIADLEVIAKQDEGRAANAPMPTPTPQGPPAPSHMPAYPHASMQPAQQMPMHSPLPAQMHMQRPPSANFAPPPPMPMHMQRPPSASHRTPPMPVSAPQAQGPIAPGNQIQLPFPTAQNIPSPAPPKQPANFVDPAIMSIGRSPAQQKATTPALDTRSPATPSKSAMAKAADSLPAINTSPYVADPIKLKFPAKSVMIKEANQKQQQKLEHADETVAAEVDGEGATPGDATGKTKRGRRGIRNKNKGSGQSQEVPAVMNVEVSRNGNDMNGAIKRGKGWRQTPLLQPSPQPGATPTKKTSDKMSRKQREEQKEGQNGWATEEATDIQDLGDFDFEASNTLFDKKQVFDELRQGDTTADEDRLVGFNRLARPGTYGGKNLHPTENVLSPKLAAEDDSSDADTEMNFHTGRSSSRHSASKRQTSRQNSTVVEGRHPLASSISSERGLTRSAVSLVNRSGKPSSSKGNASPRPDRLHSPHSVVSSRPAASPRPAEPTQGPHLTMQHSNMPCPVLLPAALETLESETTSRYGLTQDAITETAARSIAELAMSMIDPVESTSRRGSRTHATRTHLNPITNPPVIVVLAGNHAAGARAVAAARHLAPRHSKIILAEAQYESAATQEEQMVKQTLMLKRMARSGADVKRGTWRKASNYIKNLSGPPAIIIDALLAGATYDSLLSPNAAHSEGAQREAREMIDWANRSRAPVLSIACPSGVSGADGSTTLLDGEPLAVRPDRVLALGAPMIGLLEAIKAGEGWEVSLADVGINIALRIEEAVGFGGAWVDGLRFVEE